MKDDGAEAVAAASGEWLGSSDARANAAGRSLARPCPAGSSSSSELSQQVGSARVEKPVSSGLQALLLGAAAGTLSPRGSSPDSA